mmetsp:Transcript_12200/g.27601  ORF Transcript_12200/g.27601 Transcript_12200/m.27601 type:complete len:750 (-) Transcript_12200:50-2299(-)
MGCGAGVLPRNGSEPFQTTTSSFGSRLGLTKVSSFEDGEAPTPQVVEGLEQLKSVVEEEGARFLQIKLEAPTPTEQEHAEFGTDVAGLLSSLTVATHLQLDLLGTTWTDELVTLLCDALAVLVRLQHLEIRLRSDAVTDTSAVSLANALEGLVRLRHLALDLKSDYIGDLGAAAIATVFEDLPNLREVILDFSSTSLADQGLHALANGLSQIGKLQQLQLHIGGTGVGSHAIGTLARRLSKSLEHIELDLSFTAAGEFAALALASSLRANSFNKLRKLVLNFGIAAPEGATTPANKASDEETVEVAGSIGQKGMLALSDAITTLPALTQLTLKLRNQPVDVGLRTEGDKETSPLSATLTAQSRLQHLCLDLRGTKLSTASVQSLVAPIRALQECRHFEFWLADCKNLSDSMVPLPLLPLLESISLLSGIETLSLDVSDIALGKDGSAALATTISALSGLQRLQLTATRCSLGDAIQAVLPSFENCLTLTTLQLDFSCNTISPEAHEAIAAAAGSASALTHLSLRLESTAVDDSILEGLATRIATLTSLSTLELRLRASSEPGDQVHDRGLKALSAAIERLMNLQTLVVRLPSSDIGDEGFVALGVAVGNKALERLEVDLGATTRARERAESCIITDTGFKAVTRKLRITRTLAYFVLKIANSGISATGVVIFANILQEHVRLQEVDFDFHGCELGDAGVNELTSAVVKLPALYHVDLDLRGCSLSGDATKNLEETLRTADRHVFNEVRV